MSMRVLYDKKKKFIIKENPTDLPTLCFVVMKLNTTIYFAYAVSPSQVRMVTM